MTEQKAIEIGQFMPDEAALFEVLAPNGQDGTGWIITFAGPSHEKAVAWANNSAKKTLRRQAQLEAQQYNGRKVKPDERDPADVRKENVQWVVSRILDWTPVTIKPIRPEPFVFSEQVATELLLRHDMGWAFQQLVEFLANDKSFTKASATN